LGNLPIGTPVKSFTRATDVTMAAVTAGLPKGWDRDFRAPAELPPMTGLGTAFRTLLENSRNPELNGKRSEVRINQCNGFCDRA
jgi:hypothetical protein